MHDGEARGAVHVNAARSCFPEHPACNSSWAVGTSTAWAESNSHSNPWPCSPGLQTLSILGLLRAAPLTTCQGNQRGSRSGFSYKSGSWLQAQAPAPTRVRSAAQMGESGWASALQMCINMSLLTHVVFRFATRDCNEKLTMTFYLRLLHGTKFRQRSLTLSGVSTKLIVITPAKWKENFAAILYVKILVWAHLVCLFFCKISSFYVHQSYTISAPSRAHGDLNNNNWNLL